MHHGWFSGVATHPDTIVSILPYGEEDVYDIEMESPFHNYIANGFVVHNSTRYVDYCGRKTDGHCQFIIPPWIKSIDPGVWEYLDGDFYQLDEEGNRLAPYTPDSGASDLWLTAMDSAQRFYKSLREEGWAPQQARSVLPNSTKTEIVVTANLREWREIFKQRTAKAAHPQMREVMIPLLKELQRRLPVVFDDINPYVEEVKE